MFVEKQSLNLKLVFGSVTVTCWESQMRQAKFKHCFKIPANTRIQNHQVPNSRISPAIPPKAFPAWMLSPINLFLCFIVLQLLGLGMIPYHAPSTTKTWAQISCSKGQFHICGLLRL